MISLARPSARARTDAIPSTLGRSTVRAVIAGLLVSTIAAAPLSAQAVTGTKKVTGKPKTTGTQVVQPKQIGPPARVAGAKRPGASQSGASTKKYRLRPPPSNFSPPLASFPGAEFNWGSVLQGEVVEHDFEIKNTGGSVLKVERVKPSCGCTTVDFDKLIPPGQVGKVKLRVETKKFTGTVKKTAQVTTNASNSTQQLIMTGKIDPVVTVDPKLPRIETVVGMKAEPLAVTLTKAAQHSYRVLEVSSKTDIVTPTLEEVKPGEEYKILMTPNLPDSTRKYHYAQVDVKVEVGEKTFDLPIRVSVTVKERIEATPASVYFSRKDTEALKSNPETPAVKTVTVKCLDPQHSFDVTSVEIQPTKPGAQTYFQVAKEIVDEGKEYRIRVTLPQLPQDNSRRLVEKIIVKTNDEKIQEIKINATASIGRAPNANRTRPTRPVRRTGSLSPGGKVQPVPAGKAPTGKTAAGKAATAGTKAAGKAVKQLEIPKKK